MDVEKYETDDAFGLVLELDENDPLFKKKKKLLEKIGFDSEISVPDKCSVTPDRQKNYLNKLIRQARIINLNETELYFCEDIINLVNFYSPRNELQALSSILEFIDKSLSRDKNAMQSLRVEIVDRINEVGSKFGEETNILECFNCDKEKCLLDWGFKNGVKSKLDIAYVEGAGRGAIARENLKVGDIAMEIPLSFIISEELVHESNMFPILEEIDGISMETMLLLWSMKEKYNDNSRFKLYFDTLPEKFNTGLSFGIDAVMALDGTLLLEEIVQVKEHLRSQYDELFPALCDHHPDTFPPEFYSWEHFLWACELWYSNSIKVIFSDGMLRTCLIPIAGFLNHSTCAHIMHYGRIDANTNSLKFPLSRACCAGEQCFLSYGNFSNSHFLTFYGFLPKGDNPYDVIPLDFDVARDEDCEDVPEWLTHIVRGTWFSKNHEIFNYGLPPPLLNHLRKTRDPEWKPDTITREILETELDILGDLRSTFQEMMDALGDDNLDERERTSWDVELAIEFKSSQKKMFSSILTSCNAGCELLKCQLQKFTV